MFSFLKFVFDYCTLTAGMYFMGLKKLYFLQIFVGLLLSNLYQQPLWCSTIYFVISSKQAIIVSL